MPLIVITGTDDARGPLPLADFRGSFKQQEAWNGEVLQPDNQTQNKHARKRGEQNARYKFMPAEAAVE